MANRTVGLYLGDNTVDLVELEKSLSGVKLISFNRAEISGEALTQGSEPWAKAIREVLKENKIKPANLITSLPEKALMIRYFKMPCLPKKERDMGVRFEAKKYIPFKLEEIISDFQVIEPEKGSSQMEVVFVAAKKASVEQHLLLLRQAGLKSAVIEASCLSLARLFYFNKEIKKDETTVIIDVGLNSASITVLKNEALYLTRNVTLAKTAQTPGSGSEFESLLNELRLSLDYHKKQFPGEAVSRIILSGNSKLEGWDRLLNQELKIPVAISDFRKAIQDAVKMPSGLAIASGLALRGLARKAIDINLALRPKKTAAAAAAPIKVNIQKIIFGEVAIIGLLLLVLYLTMFNRLSGKKEELRKLTAQRPRVEMELNVDRTAVSSLSQKKNDLIKKLYFLESLIGQRVYWTKKLSRLGKLFPEGTWINDINIESGLKREKISRSLIIEANAFSSDKDQEQRLVEEAINNIRKDELFIKGISSVNLISIEKSGTDGFETTKFKLICSSGEHKSGM
ncbi:MAG: pilus assembly protein PilM [Candidatus Omnitrophota bacterium]|nr:pilus assembly protein PilM [Candidatus Omnitrophota bacterium]